MVTVQQKDKAIYQVDTKLQTVKAKSLKIDSVQCLSTKYLNFN